MCGSHGHERDVCSSGKESLEGTGNKLFGAAVSQVIKTTFPGTMYGRGWHLLTNPVCLVFTSRCIYGAHSTVSSVDHSCRLAVS